MTSPQKHSKNKVEGEPLATTAHGWLRNVDPTEGTAQLERIGTKPVPLRFSPALIPEIGSMEFRFVTVSGQGWISEDDEFALIEVEKFVDPDAGKRTIEEILNDPNPKIFDPDKVVRASEPFDVDEFLRIIREGRDV